MSEYYEWYSRDASKVKRAPKLPVNRSGLWKVIASTGETSAEVTYDVAKSILANWKQKVQFKGVKMKIDMA
jgi:hypothetical protein